MYLESIRHCLSNLLRFSGRDRPGRFWPYALTVFGLSIAVFMVPFLAFMARTTTRMHEYAREHPDQATVSTGPGQYSIRIDGHHPELFDGIGSVFLAIGASALVIVILASAAITRRLHDTGIPGWVALIPLILLGTQMWLMQGMFAAAHPEPGRFLLGFFVNLGYLASVAGLVFLLVRRSSPEPNRYGPPPA